LDGQLFCSKCGQSLSPDALASLGERLSAVESLLASNSKSSESKEQKYLELETSERIVARVMKWAKMFAYLVGIPVAVAIIVLGLFVGKGELDLRSFVNDAKKEASGILQEAKDDSSEAKRSASDALNTAQQVNHEIHDTKTKIGDLKTQVDVQLSEVQKLASQLTAEQNQLEAQSRTLQHTSQQMGAITTAKSLSDVRGTYPIFGKHIARAQTGAFLDPSLKTSGTKWLALDVQLSSVTAPVPGADELLAKAIASLTQYQVFLGAIYTYAQTERSAQAVGMGLDDNSCTYWPKPSIAAPCILYFDPGLKADAAEVRDAFKDVQFVPNEHILYVDPRQLGQSQQELLKLSGIDFVVVLNLTH
jgi:hypothetical protein